jgi:hypothetical protein
MPYDTNEIELKQFFGMSEVKKIMFEGYNRNMHNGSALVQFTTKNAAKQALLKDQALFNNRQI